jgi:Uma2 family endonuclease
VSGNVSRREFDDMIDAGLLSEDDHVELVNGRIVAMSPEGPWHAGTIDLCAEVLRGIFGAACTIRIQHPLGIDPDGEPEPDIAVVAGGPRAHLGRHPQQALLVVEVAESSLDFDRGEKAMLYARAGFPEYWIVNLRASRLEVHRDPTPAGYLSVVSLSPERTVAALAAPATAISVAALLP